MTLAPVLLVESLDAVGSAPEDAFLRAAALRSAGFSPQVLVLAPPGARDADLDRLDAGGAPVVPWRDGRLAIRSALAERPAALAVVAAATAAAEGVARWLPAGLAARWWPTGMIAAPTRRLPWLLARGLESLPGTPACSPGQTAELGAALEWAVVDEGALERRRLPLWDGEYLLAPAPLAGSPGQELLVAFATLAAERDRLDLVVLADPQAPFERLARSLGVGTRVHFAGLATREAEWTWLAPATAALFAGPGPIAASTVARALALGCPVVPIGSSGIAPGLGAWLAGHGAGKVCESALAGLADAARRGAEVQGGIERGRSLAADCGREALARRLAAALPSGGESGARPDVTRAAA